MNSSKLNLCPNCFKNISTDIEKCPSCSYNICEKSKNTMALTPMTVVAERYVIGRVLGSGGFGVTYKAKDLLTDEICAIKEYFPVNWAFREQGDCRLVPKSENDKLSFDHGRKRFLDEARMLIKFERNNHIVHVKNFFASNDTAYIVMEYLDGINLRSLMNKQGGKIPFQIGVQIFKAIATALLTVHEQGVLHRDISPENIFITRKSEIKLIDFGSARQYANDRDSSLSVFIKPGLAPIEQYYSNGKQGPWTDIYSLAGTLYQAVSGESVPQSPDRMDNDKLKSLSQVCSSASAGWNKIIDKALKVNASERYQNIVELLDDVNKLDTVSRDDFKRIPTPIPLKPFIVIERCKYKQAWVGLKRELTGQREYSLGRSVQMSEIVVDMAEYLSRRHCIIVFNDDKKVFFVKDISANGTFLQDGTRLPAGEFVKINPNTLIFLGSQNTAIRVVLE